MTYESHQERVERDLRLLAGTRGISGGLPLEAQQLWDEHERAIMCEEVSALCGPEEQGPIANPPPCTTYQPPPTTLLIKVIEREPTDEEMFFRGLGLNYNSRE